jgi:hypothetical protein
MSVIITYDIFGVFAALEFDAVIAEEHTMGADVSEHPVEEGADIADHIRPRLATLNLSGVITNTPLNEATSGLSPGPIINAELPYTLQATTSEMVRGATVSGGAVSGLRLNGFPRPAQPVSAQPAQYRTVTNSVAGTSLQTPARVDRVLRVFEVLRLLTGLGVLLEVSTGLRNYPRMVITDLSAPRVAEDSITFALSLRELNIVETKTTKVRLRRTTQKRAQPAAEAGAKTPGWEDTDERNKGYSVLVGLATNRFSAPREAE